MQNISDETEVRREPSLLDEIINREELAQLLRVSERTVCRWEVLRDDPLPRFRQGGVVLYRKSDVEAWFLRRQSTAFCA